MKSAIIIKEGELKRIDNFFSSEQQRYRLIRTTKTLQKRSKGGAYTDAYAMEKYVVTTGEKCSFQLVPRP